MMYEMAAGVDLPLEGIAWHDLREGRAPMLPESRSRDLDFLIRQVS